MDTSHGCEATDNQRPRQARVPQENDRSLNYYADQLPDIAPRLRRLNLHRGLHSLLGGPGLRAVFWLGGAIGMMARRRYLLSSCCLAGFLLQQIRERGRRLVRSPDRDERAVERYALKVQRGDYGKLEVIAFR